MPNVKSKGPSLQTLQHGRNCTLVIQNFILRIVNNTVGKQSPYVLSFVYNVILSVRTEPNFRLDLMLFNVNNFEF